jgi:cytochrome c
VAEIIEIREFQAARARAQRRRDNRQSLQTAVDLMRDNLAAAAELMRSAPETAQPELLDRVEKLAAMIRYGMRMLEETEDDTRDHG